MKKKILIFLLVAAVLGGGTAGGYSAYRGYRDGHTVAEVQSVESLNWGYWGADMECSGIVTNDVAQQIYLNSEQSVEEVYVEEGQAVSVGDPLLKYDETSIQYSIQMKELDIETIQNNTAIANRTLIRLSNMKPIEEKEDDTEEETEVTAQQAAENDISDWQENQVQQFDPDQTETPDEVLERLDAGDAGMQESQKKIPEEEEEEKEEEETADNNNSLGKIVEDNHTKKTEQE